MVSSSESSPASGYTPAQLTTYLTHIGLPPELYHPSSPTALPRDINLLRTLHAAQIASIPYENLSLHYRDPSTIQPTSNQHHTPSGAHMSLDPQYLFEKFVARASGRGGYCFQIVTFFAHILRAMGFAHTYTAQARIRLRDPATGVPSGKYVGFRHAVNIVTLPDGTRWDLDVSFGGDGPIAPLPLVEGVVSQNIGTQQLRLIRDYIPEQHDKLNAGKLWVYQYRNASDREWNSYYAFPEIEYTPADLEIANWYTSQFPESFQTKQVIVVKFLARDVAVDDDEQQQQHSPAVTPRKEIYGKIMLAGAVVKRNTGGATGRTEIVTVCGSEAERIAALERYFGIRLFPEEIGGIEGRETEIRE